MYENHNDDELLYLIREENNEKAKRLFYYKYIFLIKKLYYNLDCRRSIVFLDFQQECLIILEKSMYLYRYKENTSFYGFFLLCVKRGIIKMLRDKRLYVSEGITNYDVNLVPAKTNYSKLAKIIIREYKDKDSLEWLIIENCIFNNIPVKRFCRENNLVYEKTFYIYKKIRLKLEKMLT